MIVAYILIGIVFGLLSPYGFRGFFFNLLMWPALLVFIIALFVTMILGTILAAIGVGVGAMEYPEA